MAGLYFEEFEPGAVIEHVNRRTVTETDNVLFSTLTLNLAPLHLDAEYSKNSIHGQRLVNSLFILGLVSGITVPETTQGTTLGNLGFQEIKFPKPVFHGDTIHVRTEIVATRESKSRDDSGIVTFRHLGINQRDEIVCDAVRVGLMMKRPVADKATADS
ncbi:MULTISPECIES: MaoC family dehydratase [Streptomyces]|uniref:MaoC family dehydratase n=1 Tax=Streptomyces cinereoruber TaxID=67260 RepID=A0ABX6BL71_9ACTN|nr:MaoC family dehydratase [Streptomyces cinereoruber]MBB4158251.1 acyl dehydratase [Streptomyces cinereoruber]MBY8819215.1 MaoC family dehydratase [Streptomyces cinereoruber]NIH63384.1 acyl dehydratase [Streptomyces cinereoruber]QEV36041.1 MaoC family dehydratase [Streptomyces cinereoruber]